MKNFEYIYPKNAESIPGILKDSGPGTMIYAGGTDALARLKEGLDRPEKIVNLTIDPSGNLNGLWTSPLPNDLRPMITPLSQSCTAPATISGFRRTELL